MKILGSVLSNILAGIVGVFSLASFMRAANQGAGGPEPEKQSAGADRDSRAAGGADRNPEPSDPYYLPLPQHGEPLRPGWGRPDPEVVARPTYWPMVFGLGIAFFMWGLISNLFVLGLGLFFLLVGLVGWVLDLVAEFSEPGRL
jgi:hypothetical protein